MSRIDDFDPSLALPPPPLNIAATGPKTIEVAARWADGVSFSVGADVERLRSSIALAHEACERVGRDPATLALGCYVQVAVDDDGDRRAREAIRGLVVTHARFSGFEAKPVEGVESADHERYRHAVETMEAVYRDTRGGVERTEGSRPGEIDFYPQRGRRRRADRRVRDRRPGRLLRRAAGARSPRSASSGSTSAPAPSASTSTRRTPSGSGARCSPCCDERRHGTRGPARPLPAGRGRGRTTSRSSSARCRRRGPGRCSSATRGRLSIPGLRVRLREKGPEGYFVAFPLGAPMDGIMTIGEVVESRAEGFAPGDTVWHASGWRDYAVVTAGEEALRGIGTLRRLDVDGFPPQAYLGVLGGNGLTAYAGLLRVSGLREGDVVWVSAAAGAVGSIVAQLAKLRGHRVVGSAGSAAKVAYLLDELSSTRRSTTTPAPSPSCCGQAAPDGIDVYFDNVGGDHLEAAIGALRRGGRVAICGAISEYDAAEPPPGPSNLFLLVAKDLEIRGFRGSSHVDLLDEMQRELGALLRDGRLVWRETVVEGLEAAPEALARMMRGETTGKTLVRIA